MKLIDEFEAAHMTHLQFLYECYERLFTYQDYLNNCEMLKRQPCSKNLFNHGRILYEGVHNKQ